jgi:pyruvate dehydrogenase E2 component (dihydrolipoamide acetyltransferase)
MNVDLRNVPPSGTKGRVTKEDVVSFASGGGAGLSTVEPSPPRTTAPARALTREPVSIRTPADEQALETRKPFVGIRRKIAERMQATKNTAAHFTFVEECDVGRLIELRTRLRPRAEAEGVKLSYLPFIVKAVVASLKRHPVLNSALDESSNELVTRRYYHVGIAAQTDVGLKVPVIRDADRLTLLDIAREIDRLGEGARAGTLAPQELTGSTFTITSLGKQGGLFATPILNHPEVGILGVHQMKQKPVVRDGAIVIGDVMLLSLSFDHRIVDGQVGAAFAYDVIDYLEDPGRLMLEMI